MGDNRTDLPEGTDTIIDGAANTGTPGAGASGAVTTESTADVIEREIIERDEVDSNAIVGRGRTGQGGLAERLRTGRERLTEQAGGRARGLVTQGLERSAEALSNVSRMIGDTAEGIEERLGAEYGDYARRAASAIEEAADNLASKDPDELIDDTREFVRRSPGVALAGAAVVGFAVARLIKSGLAGVRDADDEDDDRGSRGTGRRSSES